MTQVRVFVSCPDAPGDAARAAISRAQAAARRFEGDVDVRVVCLDEDEAMLLGAAVEPTVAVGDLIVAVGQAPPAGHLVRAIEAAQEDGA